MYKSNQKGFTLLEILIVLIILGVIAGIAIPAFQGQIEKGRAQEAYRNIAMVKEALVRFYSQREPATFQGATMPTVGCNAATGLVNGQTLDVNPNCTNDPAVVTYFQYTIGNLTNNTWTITATRRAGGPCANGTITLTQADRTPIGTGCFV